MMKFEEKSRRAQLLIIGAFVVTLTLLAASSHSQSGRQKQTNSNTPANTNTRPRQTSKPSSTASQTSPQHPADNAGDQDEVVKVTSNLVPVPATVVDGRGVAVMNLKLEDFELRVDGQPNPITEISRSETPVRMAMLFDNSGSLSESREFEKRAAMRFFRSVMRPVDQAAIYSVSTDVVLVQSLTADVPTLERTSESFGKPEGSTALFDAIA